MENTTKDTQEKQKKKHGAIKFIESLFMTCLCIGLIGVFSIISINVHMKQSTKNRILSISESVELKDVDCILVLGCSVHGSQPSLMLRDRLERGVELYHNEVSPKMLMSGDHGRDDYDEVGTMKQYAIDKEVPSSDIFMDHAGFSTYESMYRAKEIFQAKKIVVITQEYHLYRALYVANKLGLNAYGVAAEGENYYGQEAREVREILARVKDFATVIFTPEPTYTGETIDISGDGNETNDVRQNDLFLLEEASLIGFMDDKFEHLQAINR